MSNEGDVAWYEITVVENVFTLSPQVVQVLMLKKKALNFNFKKAMYRVVFLQKSVIYCLTGPKDRTLYHCFFSLHQAMKVCEPDIHKERWSFPWPWVRPCLVPSRLSLSRWKNCAQRKSERRNFLSFSFSWILALRRLSLAFRARLCAKIDAPKEEAGIRPLFQMWFYERQNCDNENHKAKKCDLMDLFHVSLHDV